MRVPFADGTLVQLPKEAASDDHLLSALLTLSDVMGTGHHAALGAGARKGATVAVVGDGAVGLCAVLAAKRLGAERIIALGRHQARTDIARAFGATDVVAERGEAAVEAVRELTRGQGAHAVVEAVGTEQSMRTAVNITRDGGAIGFVGVPHGSGTGLDLGVMFDRNIALRGGVAPAGVHPGAAARHPGRHHRPVARLQHLTRRSGRRARRLQGDGRAHRPQGARHQRLMTT